MLKKSICIIILLQLLGLLDACCGGGRYETQWVRFKLDTIDYGFPLNPVDSIQHLNYGAMVNLVDSTTRIAALWTGLTPVAYALQCDPDEIKPITTVSKMSIFTLTNLANQVPAMSDVTNLFIDGDTKTPLDSTRIRLNEFNDIRNHLSFFRVRFQPSFVVHQICRFRFEIRMSDGRVMQQDTKDLKLF